MKYSENELREVAEKVVANYDYKYRIQSFFHEEVAILIESYKQSEELFEQDRKMLRELTKESNND